MVYSSISNIKTTKLASHRTVILNHGWVRHSKVFAFENFRNTGIQDEKKNLYITHTYSGVHFIIYEH